MKNFFRKKGTIDFEASSDVASGEPLLIGEMFAVAAGDVAQGEMGVAHFGEDFILPIAEAAEFSEGDAAYFDESEGEMVTTSADGDNKLVAYVTGLEPRGDGDVAVFYVPGHAFDEVVVEGETQ